MDQLLEFIDRNVARKGNTGNTDLLLNENPSDSEHKD